MKHNCFTTVYNYLNLRYSMPKEWNGYTDKDMDLFVKDEKKFLAKKEHIGFFKSFCTLSKTVGVAINQFTYWVYNEDLDRVEHKKLDKNCLIMRIQNG